MDVGNNNIGPKGCKYVSMGQWPKLEEIILGSILLIQPKTN